MFVHDFNVRARGEIIFVRLLRSETRKRIQSDPPNVYMYICYVAFQRPLRRTKHTLTVPVISTQHALDPYGFGNNAHAICSALRRTECPEDASEQHMWEIFKCHHDRNEWMRRCTKSLGRRERHVRLLAMANSLRMWEKCVWCSERGIIIIWFDLHCMHVLMPLSPAKSKLMRKSIRLR